MIVAVSKNGVIGNDNKLLWKLPKDMKNFKKLTSNNDVIMGRKTYDSIGRPLPNRVNIVISRSYNNIDGAIVVGSIVEALSKTYKNNDTYIIGGAEIYKQTINYCDEVILTLVDCYIEGDSKIDINSLINGLNKDSVVSYSKDVENEYNFDIITYKR